MDNDRVNLVLSIINAEDSKDNGVDNRVMRDIMATLLGKEKDDIQANTLNTLKPKYNENLAVARTEINNRWAINYYRPVSGGKFKTFFKRLIRKIMAPIMVPLFNEQRDFNASVTRSINELTNEIGLYDVYNHINTLKDEIESLKAQNELLSKKTNGEDEEYRFFKKHLSEFDEQKTYIFKSYAEYFSGRSRVFHFGCESGEVLEMLKNKNIEAIGVEPCGLLVDECRKKGLTVQQRNCKEFLFDMSAKTCDGILYQENISNFLEENITDLSVEFANKLASDGILVVVVTKDIVTVESENVNVDFSIGEMSLKLAFLTQSLEWEGFSHVDVLPVQERNSKIFSSNLNEKYYALVARKKAL